VVESDDAILVHTEYVVSRYHDPQPGSMCRVAVAPCSPFSVTPQLMRDSATYARQRGLRLHTHVAETLDEEQFCHERFGMRPLELMEDLGWVGPDVWYAHGIHFNDSEVDRVAEDKTGIAHCPSSNMRLGAGGCRVQDLLRAGARLGLGVDGSASNEDANIAMEAHQALLLARVRNGSPQALDARTVWGIATKGGAECLGRDDCGTLEPGKCADIACFRVDDLAHAGIKDLVAGLVLAPPNRAQTVIVNGRAVVRGGKLLSADEDQITRDIAATSRRLAG